MRQVAIVLAVNLAAIAAATFILYRPQSQDALIQDIRREQQQLELRSARIEQMLAATLNRSANVTGEARASPVTDTATIAAPAPLAAEERAAHEELVQSGNEWVDRTIATGVVRASDFVELASVTAGLSAEERMRVMGRLSAALNLNQVRLEDAVP